MALSTLEKLKGLLQISIADPVEDVLLTRLLESASAWVETQCGYPSGMVASSYTFMFGGEGTRGWTPNVRPLVSVTSVTIDGEVIPAKAADVDGWYVSDAGRVELSGSYRFTRGWGNCVVVATCGYPANAIPADLEAAVLTLAALRFRDKEHLGQVSANVGGTTVSFSTYSAPSDVLLTLASYRMGSV